MDRVVKGNIVLGSGHPGIQGKEVTTARREKAGVGGVGRVKQNWVQTQTALGKSVDIPVSQLPSLRKWGTTVTGKGCTHCVCTVHKHTFFFPTPLLIIKGGGSPASCGGGKVSLALKSKRNFSYETL